MTAIFTTCLDINATRSQNGQDGRVSTTTTTTTISCVINVWFMTMAVADYVSVAAADGGDTVVLMATVAMTTARNDD